MLPVSDYVGCPFIHAPYPPLLRGDPPGGCSDSMQFRVESVDVSEEVLHVVAPPSSSSASVGEPLRFFVPREAYEPAHGARLECESHARAEDAPSDAECTLSGVVVEAGDGWLLASHGGLPMRLPRRLAPGFGVGDSLSVSMWAS